MPLGFNHQKSIRYCKLPKFVYIVVIEKGNLNIKTNIQHKNITGERLTEEIRCVVFDLDDTLCPEIDYCKSGFKVAANAIADRFKFDRGDVYQRLYDTFALGNRKKLFNAVLDAMGAVYDERFVSALVEQYRNHIPDISLPSQSRIVLDKLRKKAALGLLTDGYMPAQRLKVQALGIEDYFDVIVYTELLGREKWKPSTAGFELIMARTGFKPCNYVYVADNPSKDFIAPNRLGWRSVWYKNPAGVHKTTPQTDEQRAEFEINELLELTGILGYGD